MHAITKRTFVAVLPFLPSIAAYQASSGADRAFAIQNVVAKYAIVVDDHRWDTLEDVFVEDVVASYMGANGVESLQGLPAVQNFLQTSLGNLSHQHALTTQYIEDHVSGAKATTYFTATFFNTGNETGSFSIMGKYIDEFTQQLNGEWKIISRNQTFSGPYIGYVTMNI